MNTPRLHNGTFSISQMRKSKLACDLPWREKVREADNRTRYLSGGKELDTETNLYNLDGKVLIGIPPLVDVYDFNMDGRKLRDFATWLGRPGSADAGVDYKIYGYGAATVPQK